MTQTLLAGDIGGTKTILRLLSSEVRASNLKAPQQTSLFEQTYASQEFSDLVPMVHQFLRDSTSVLDSMPTIGSACFGIAGPVVNNTSNLTNLNWSLSAERLQQELQIKRVTLLNDFVANGYGVLGLGSGDLVTLQDVPPEAEAPIALIGSGTGLGHGFIIPLDDNQYRVFPSEGGHTDFAPRSPLELQLLSYLKERYNLSRVSVERIVSGAGIVAIYEFLRQINPEEESAEFGGIYQMWLRECSKGGKKLDLAAEISRAALKDHDYLCTQTMRMYIDAYGATAGDLALKLLPYGGLYIAGGIAAKNLPLIEGENFMKAFRNKGRMSGIMSKIPVHLITNPKVGLIGAGIRAAI